jgi:hypothetical protein
METGLIYRISWPSGEYYIGSTTKTLQKRLSAHKSMSQRWSNKFYNFAREQGWNYCKTEAIQTDIPVGELFDVEREYIIAADAKDGTAVLNTMSVYKKTAQEMMDERRKRDREYSRSYYQRNKETILAKRNKNNLTTTTDDITESP